VGGPEDAGPEAGGSNSGSLADAAPQNGPGVHAVGNQLYDGSKAIRLLGVNRPGSEYACLNGNMFDPADGSGNNAATITAMLAWHVNAVRVPLNEDCWLGLNGVPAQASGAAYQAAIKTWVDLLLQNAIYPIIELHWTEGPGGAKATGQQPMPDATHGAELWTAVATAYGSQPKVIFELFNEPYPANDTDNGWACWRDGGTGCGPSYAIVGMQGMLNAVRAAGAKNFVLLGGLEYSNDLTKWVQYEPTDPANNLGAAWHVYTNSATTGTKGSAAYMTDADGVAMKVPIVATEIGDAACGANGQPANGGAFISGIMSFIDALTPPQSYLGWAWSTDDQPIMISSYDGTPTCGGIPYKAHLLATPH